MKKLFFAILIIALGGAAYYFYNNYYQVKDFDLWSLVPEHSLIVYESSSLASNYNHVHQTEVGGSLLKIPAFDEFNDRVKRLDSLENEQGLLGTLVKGKSLISVHITGNNTLGTAFYKEISTVEQKEAFTKLIDEYKQASNFSFTTRKYQGKVIYELINNGSSDVFSYFLEGNILVASATPFLVEDVIRLLDSGNGSFKEANSALYNLPRLSNDEGNVYVNTKKVKQYTDVFGQFAGQGDLLNSFGKSSFMDVNVDDRGVYLNGFTEYDPSDFLSVFSNQQPIKSDLKYFIPNNATYTIELSFNNATSFFSNLKKFYSSKPVNKQRSEFNEKYALENEFGTDWVKDNLGIVGLDRDLGQLFYVNTTDVNEALNQLNTLGESVAAAVGDSVYVERYSTYEIRELGIKNFTKYKFLPLVADTEVSYYTALENYIVFSHTIQNLKVLIDAVENENTWGRSVTFNSFLDRTLEESNFSFLINADRFIESIQPRLEGDWNEFVKNNISSFKNFYLASLQLSRLDNNFYTSLVIGHNKGKEVEKQNFAVAQSVDVKVPINSKPFVVRNHISNLKEVVVLDSANRLRLISNAGDLLWSKQLEGGIVGELEQIDFYENGKLQYFFATPNQLHILDRNGNYIEGFPKEVKGPISHIKVIDYDNSKRYRFLTADERGNIYLYNKEGDNLDGWNPRKLEGVLTSTPFHIRVRRKDCFVNVLSNGQVTLLNRRGVALSGFPLDLEARLNTGVNVKLGSDFKNTIFTTITRDGRLIKFNMEGQVLETEQLYKPTKDSEFRVVSDALGKSFILIRKDLNRIVVLDEEANELFAKDYLDADGMLVQYYDFSPSNKLYAITDKIQGFTYLYDVEGRLINTRPLDSEFEVGVIYSEVRDDLKVYAVSGSTFKILQFN